LLSEVLNIERSAFQISVVKRKDDPAKESIDSCRIDNKKGSSYNEFA